MFAKIDIHTHILPKNWPDLRERYGYGGWLSIDHHGPGCAKLMVDGKLFREVSANLWDVNVRLAECEKHGVQMQVLSTVPVMFSYGAKPEHTLDLSRILNDHIADLISRSPARFAGLGTVPMQDPERAITELERCVNDLHLSGVQIGTHVNDWNLNEASLFPFFQAAEKLGAAVFVHPWDMMGKDRMQRYWLPWLVGMPAESSRAICSMIFGGVFERLPKLRVAFAHGGGSFPATFGRISHGFEARPDLCAVDNPVPPNTYLGRFYVDSLTHDPAMLRHLIGLIGIGKIALGSDYPFPLGEKEPGRMIEGMNDLDSAARARLFNGTAIEWLGIKDK